MRLFNVYKIFYLNNPNSSSFGDFYFFGFKCNQSYSQDIVHVQLWKILELKKEEEKKDKIEIYFNCCPGWHIQWQR
jgi:hypothetical protein